MTDHQLKPFEEIDLAERKDRLQVFEEQVLQYSGNRSSEDSSVAPLPESYPYRTRISRNVYEKEKKKLQIELLKVQSWVKESGSHAAPVWWPWRNPATVSAANGISSATSTICPLPAKWYFSTAPGTTVPA